MSPNHPVRSISAHTTGQLAGKPGTNTTLADARAAALEKARMAGQIRAANTGNLLTGALAPGLQSGAGNDLARVAAQNRGTPLQAAGAMPLGGNALTSAQPGRIPLQSAMLALQAERGTPANLLVSAGMPTGATPTPAPPMPAPAPQASASPNPALDAMAAHVQAQNLSPADIAAAAKRSDYMVHALAPLVRQDGPITTGQLVKVANQGIKDKVITPEQASMFLGRLSNEPAQIRQAVTAQLNASLLASIHSTMPQQANTPTPPAPDGN